MLVERRLVQRIEQRIAENQALIRAEHALDVHQRGHISSQLLYVSEAVVQVCLHASVSPKHARAQTARLDIHFIEAIGG